MEKSSPPYTVVASRSRLRRDKTDHCRLLKQSLVILASLILIVPNYAFALQQQVASMQPIFTKNMDSLEIKENTPIGEIIYELKAEISDFVASQAHIFYGIEGTQLFSVDKISGKVKIAQPIDREQTSDQITFQVTATIVFNSNPPGQASSLKYGPATKLTITVFILDENDNPPKIEHIKIGPTNYDSASLERQSTISSGNFLFASLQQQQPQRTPIVRLSLSESTPVDSVVVDLIEAIDVDKASSKPLRSICHDCSPEFELRSTTNNLLNDRLNTTIVLVNPLVHVPRNNTRQLHVIVNDGKFDSMVLFEITIEDVQNKPPQFIGSTTCITYENVPIDTTVMIVHAIDGDAIGIDEIPNLPAKKSTSSPVQQQQQQQNTGRQLLYDLLDHENRSVSSYENFKLHPLTGELQVADRLDRESYLSLNGVLSLRVRARELMLTPGFTINKDDQFESILEKSAPSIDPAPEATSEVDITIIIVDVNDNKPHWLNASEIAELNMNQEPNWYRALPDDRDPGRIYKVQVKENSLPGSPITFKNEMFVYDLDNGENSIFNISIRDQFNLFDVEPKMVSGFALVTLKLSNHGRKSNAKLLDYENTNERNLIIQLIATEVNTREMFTSTAQVHIEVLDVNDNAPEFREPAYVANVREDAPAGKTVMSVQAYDKDEISRQIVYSLHGKSAHLFDINRNTGLISVAKCDFSQQQQVVRSRIQQRTCIDYEQQRSHHLMVEASDGEFSTKVPLTIFVDDASDNAPIFSLPVIDAVIEEGANRLDPPIKIEATDVDQSSVVSYSIVEGNFEGLFSVNNATGELQLTRPIRIQHDETGATGRGDDYRQQQLNKITLVVQATDGMFKTNGTIRIDVLDANDNAPKFFKQNYYAELPETAAPGQPVITVRAVDMDRGNNARVSYRIERGSFGQFEVDEALGVVSVARTARDFDSARRENYTLELVAYDHGLVSRSSSVLVLIRVLDTILRVPKFEPQVQRTLVSESTYNNTVIHRMSVAELDAMNTNLFYEPGPIEALDKNGQPVAAAESERLESMFSVSTNTGEVMVSSNLDHDFAALINLTIYVSSRQLAANPTNESDESSPRSPGYLIITVMDDNSNAPIFAAPWSAIQPELTFQMAEELPVGSVLTQLVASDVDSKISHFKIEPVSDYFELASPQSGIIVNKKLIDYDALMRQTFKTPASHRANHSAALMATNSNNIIQFNVFVFDSGIPQLSAKATISVEITPVNDWDCKFERSVYEARVKENTQSDTLITQVRAIDLDYGEQHNSIRYQLVGEHKDLFNIDPRNGLVTVSARGSAQLDRERLSQPTFSLTVIGRDEQNPGQTPPAIVSPPRGGKNQQHQHPQSSRTCSATIIVHVDDVNDNPPLFSQKLYDVTAYDTDAIDVPLVKLIIRDDDSINTNSSAASRSSQPTNVFKIISGNINDSFNVTNSGLIYATKQLNETFAHTREPVQLRVQVKQQSPNILSGVLPSFTDECVVRINFVKINRHGPEWRLETLKAVTISENAKPGTLVRQLKCSDRDYDLKGSTRLIDQESELAEAERFGQLISPIRYWIKENGSNVIETNEFKLDPVTGSLVTRIELDREAQGFYQLIVTCEDNGKPQSLESITSLFITVLDMDDNKPEFLMPKTQEASSSILKSGRANAVAGRMRPTITFTFEERQSKGLPVGELKAFDRDFKGSYPISYCLIEGNDFQEFALDRVTGILYTNQTLDRERQSFYDLLVKAINDDSSCESHMPTENNKDNNSTMTLGRERRNLHQGQLQANQRNYDSSNYISVRVEVLDINDNAPVFKRPIYRAGVHHRSLMNSLVTQIVAFDPDAGLNGTVNYRISEILMYKTSTQQQVPNSSGKYDAVLERQPLGKAQKLVQSPFKIDQQGNIYTQQLLTQYQLMTMFELHIEATEQAEPWRMATTKLEIYVYETSSQLKIRINLHPRLVEDYKAEIETLLSNATRYTAIINRARTYHETLESSSSSFSGNQKSKVKSSATNSIGQRQKSDSNYPNGLTPSSYHDGGFNNNDEPSSSNIQLIFVDNYRIVNPNLVMEKFDLKSAQLFTPQLLTQTSANNNHITNEAQSTSDGSRGRQSAESQLRQQIEFNEVSSLIDKIALASVQASEYHTGPSSTLANIDWLESPSVIFATLAAILGLVGFVICLIGCCCTSKIKDHIIKVAMNKLVDQQNLQAKFNERVLASAANEGATINGHPNGQDYLLQQGGLMSSFDATKNCIGNNNDNLNILQRAMESGEFIDPNYTTLNGRVNLGAHYYDATELDQHQGDINHNDGPEPNGRLADVGTSKQMNDFNGSPVPMGELDNETDGGDLKMRQQQKQLITNGALSNQPRQRQQIPQ